MQYRYYFEGRIAAKGNELTGGLSGSDLPDHLPLYRSVEMSMSPSRKPAELEHW